MNEPYPVKVQLGYISFQTVGESDHDCCNLFPEDRETFYRRFGIAGYESIMQDLKQDGDIDKYIANISCNSIHVIRACLRMNGLDLVPADRRTEMIVKCFEREGFNLDELRSRIIDLHTREEVLLDPEIIRVLTKKKKRRR